MCKPNLPFPSAPINPLIAYSTHHSEFYNEGRLSKLFRRLREDPLVPIGCGLTIAALYGASKAIRRGDHEYANKMFRRRIYAQGFTIAAMVVGSLYWQSDREKRKQYDKVVAERKAIEKREAWVRELEVRDKEEREYKERLRNGRKGRIEGVLTPKKKDEEAERAGNDISGTVAAVESLRNAPKKASEAEKPDSREQK
jgi:hypothetical protein